MAGKGVGERRVKLQHLHQSFSPDDVQVAVGQRPDIGTGPGQRGLLPEDVPKHVPFAFMVAEASRQQQKWQKPASEVASLCVLPSMAMTSSS